MSPRQQGLATVECALTGAVALMVLFGCLEIGRMLFVWNTLDEATRRGAHIAAICPLNDPAIVAAVLMGGDGTRAVIDGLHEAHVAVAYLDAAGAGAAAFADTAYASVSIVGYEHTVLIPYVGGAVAVPPFTTTVPVESLGYIPETGARTCLES